MDALCALTDIPDQGAREFATAAGDIFVMRRGGCVWGYRNSCPHKGVALNWQPHDFVSPVYGMIQCSMHAALFRIEDGYCEWGPCQGRGLSAVAVAVRDAQVVLLDMPPRRGPCRALAFAPNGSGCRPVVSAGTSEIAVRSRALRRRWWWREC